MSIVGTLAIFFILGAGGCTWVAVTKMRTGNWFIGAGLAASACLLVVIGFYTVDGLATGGHVMAWMPRALPCSAAGACDLNP